MARTNKVPSIRVLFRYRDLVAHTLEEHRKVIKSNKKKACWWGWWKRPSEDGRRDVWELLQKALDQPGPVYVGLFDSGEIDDEKAVRLAKVTKIIAPNDKLGTSPPVPDKEKSLVPLYYRKSSYSRA